MSKKESGFVALPLVVAVLVLSFSLALSVPVTTTQNPDVKGTLIAKGDDSGGGGSSGGGGDSGGGSHDSGSSGGSSGGDNKSSGSGGSSGGGSSSSRVEARVEIKVEKPEKIEVKNEVKKPEAETETDIENEIEKPETEKVHISSAGGELEVETETASPGGIKTHLRLASLAVVTGSQSGQGKIKIQIHEGQFEFESQGTSALTNFPLTFDKTTNTLLVNAPDGPRPIRVLPDQAASAAYENRFETQIEKIELATASAGVTTDSTVFKVSGKRTGNLLGLIPVNADVETQVGAQSGTILFVTQPLWLRLFSGLIR